MEVKLEPHVGKNLKTGRKVTHAQYRIRVDGVAVGFVGFHSCSKICLTERFGPLEREEIETQVARLLKRTWQTSSQAPDVPDDIMNPQDEEDYGDDFDA